MKWWKYTSSLLSLEKWTAVADICRCLHNFNGVLQICAAFTNSSVFRLKDTWKRVSKTVDITCFLFINCNVASSPPALSPSCRAWSPVTADTGIWETPCTGQIHINFIFCWLCFHLDDRPWCHIYSGFRYFVILNPYSSNIKSIPLGLLLYPWHILL